jgi:NAD(P)-dependent dehydrogenase (short-subunit alcohol dehydrogenase family)
MKEDFQNWCDRNLPNLKGKKVLVTGANSGLGYHTTKGLALKGAHVIMGCRNMKRAHEAHDQLLDEYPNLSLEIEELDLADLESVREAAKAVIRDHEALDILCNNAGIMMIPYDTTQQGFEKQIGVNHLGHFALTAHLMPALLNADAARVVNISSIYHKRGDVEVDDLSFESRGYDKTKAYAQSKLANLLFTYELERRFRAHQSQAISLAAHPGYADTNLQYKGPELSGSALMKGVMAVANAVFAQSAQQGALPELYAAAHPNATGGDYFGPDGFQEMRGYPTKVASIAKAKNERLARALWEKSEALTGVTFSFEINKAV